MDYFSGRTLLLLIAVSREQEYHTVLRDVYRKQARGFPFMFSCAWRLFSLEGFYITLQFRLIASHYFVLILVIRLDPHCLQFRQWPNKINYNSSPYQTSILCYLCKYHGLEKHVFTWSCWKADSTEKVTAVNCIIRQSLPNGTYFI